MLASVTKFSVEYQGDWLHVLYVFYDEDKGPGLAGLTYCCRSPNGDQIFLMAEEIQKVALA